MPDELCRADKQFEVDDIPDARGVHRVATAEDIERVGTRTSSRKTSYWIASPTVPSFTGSICKARPGSVSEEQALEIATAYHDRLTGS